MRILFISSEVMPFAKTGGLADVAAALPEALAAAGHDLMVVTPLYLQTAQAGHLLTEEFSDLPLQVGPRTVSYSAWRAADRRSWLIDVPDLYRRPTIYTEEDDEHFRFLVLTRAALDLCLHRSWSPDIVHGNDWQSGLAPLFLRALYAEEHLFADTRSVLTIHNLEYQGVFGAGIVPDLGLGAEQYLLHQDHLKKGSVGFLEHGIIYADSITTVSPTYAREIQTPEMGAGLDGLLRLRAHDIRGILNGIDPRVWNPRTDSLIPWHFSEKSLWRKEKNKEELLAKAGLPYEKGVLVIGIISRLVGQKGIELVSGPMAGLLESIDARFVSLGSGEPRLEAQLRWLADTFPHQAAHRSGYDEPLAHLIEAGADLFLMPSRYEPCGLNQMYSLAYGTAPVVRKTGGLADTVDHFNPTTGEGNGFVFEHYTEAGLAWALGEAVTTFRDRAAWRQLQKNAMGVDNSWQHRVHDYEELYRNLREAWE